MPTQLLQMLLLCLASWPFAAPVYDRESAEECPLVFDCNANGVEDAEDIACGTSVDGNQNGVPDECEAAW